MPTEHKKSKSKPSIEIKLEGGQDVHPLGHYIDDRVELIRQIFMSLKSKTIKSIAPDFLQGKSLEAIQEYCLDELLGISKKRLQSIINATKCPDNTDSSDSDVENIEEHISLEEISSDSADDNVRAKKTKGKAKASDNKNGTTGATGSGKKQVSVLELLELQARARAIRSQLALEPVTKIELDSDNDSDDSSSSKVAKTATSTAVTSTDHNKAKAATKNVVQEANGMQIIKPTVPAVKPVRLKRNFRQRQNEDYDPDDEDDETKSTKSTKSVDNCEVKEADKKSSDEKDEQSVDGAKAVEENREEPERSPSPDLIPIIQEPETYCISSDSDEPGSSSVPKYITYPTVVREKLPETEDEIFLKKIKEGSGVDLRDLIKARRGEKQTEKNSETVDTSNDAIQSSTETTNQQASSSKNSENSNEESHDNKNEQLVEKDTEPEEGELTDGDEDEDEMDTNQITVLSSDDEHEEKSKQSESENVPQQEVDVSENKNDETSSESSSSDNDSDSDSSSDAPIFKEADDDADIIDLGKDDDLDFEMKEVVERSETKTKKIKKTKKSGVKIADKPNKIESEVGEIELNVDEKTDCNETPSQAIEMKESTEENDEDKDVSKEEDTATTADDPPESDTWQTRWLRGRNVTKVMATSRLASKVRTKIKQKKSKTELETASNPDSNEAPVTATKPVIIGPPVEEGSVQHYEVLIAQETENKNE